MAALVACVSLAGCGGGGASDGLNHRPVSGKVTLDGAPLANGLISFDPVDGSSGTISAGATVLDGNYSMDTVGGPTPGKYKVSIRSSSALESTAAATKAAPGPPVRRKKGEAGEVDPIPAKYNSASELTAEIAASGSTTADFTLTTK